MLLPGADPRPRRGPRRVDLRREEGARPPRDRHRRRSRSIARHRRTPGERAVGLLVRRRRIPDGASAPRRSGHRRGPSRDRATRRMPAGRRGGPRRGGRTAPPRPTATATDTVTSATVATRLATRKAARARRRGRPSPDRMGEDEQRRRGAAAPGPASAPGPGSSRIGHAAQASSHAPTRPHNASVANAQPSDRPGDESGPRRWRRAGWRRREPAAEDEARDHVAGARRRAASQNETARPRAIRVAIRKSPAVGSATSGDRQDPERHRIATTTATTAVTAQTRFAGTSRQEW